jgi:hypothetical protein
LVGGGILVVSAFAACGSDPPRRAAPTGDDRRAAVVDTSLEFSPLRFEDGAVSLNDCGPVRRARLNPKMPPVFVNGRPVGFC